MIRAQSHLTGLEPLNVRQFGATGDGATDDVDAINTALAFCSAIGGGIMYVPPGTYIVGPSGSVASACVVLQSNVHLVGAGIGATIIKTADGADSQTINASGIENFSVTNMTVDGNRLNQTLAVHCIRVADSANMVFQNLYLTSARHYGMGFQSGTLTNVTINKITLEDIGADGIDFKNRNDGNSGIQISEIIIESFGVLGGNQQVGIDIRGPANVSDITIKAVPDNANSGIRFRHGENDVSNGLGGHKSNLTNFRIIGVAGTDSVGVWNVARNVKITNGYVYNCSLGIRCDDMNTSIVNVHVDTCGVGFYCSSPDPVLVLTADGGSIIGCIAQSCVNYGVQIKPGADNWRLIGNRFIDNGITGVFIQTGPPTTAGTIIANNHFSGNATSPVGDAGTGTRIWNNVGYVTESRGSMSGTTNGSGDIAVTHGLYLAPTQVLAIATGTTFMHAQKTTQSSTTFTLRFFDAAGAALTGTAVAADWRAWR